ncbi:MAG: glycosyltransferase family 4 protein [Candidatus Uhrbacteria bacterium]|nr:glycosyltransferase family 4 protein [Candidatus Uhrbacteria bacterium]
MTFSPNKRVAVFFTHSVSLELWDQRGMFSREVQFYQELAKEIGEVWLFTYGEHDEQYLNRLGPNIRLFQKRCKCPPNHYAFMLPFVYRKQLREADVIRIHQVAGAIPALLAHWLYRKPIIVRAGFQWYSFAKRQGASRLKRWLISIIETFTYRSARAIIHTTQQDADFVAKRYHVDTAKLHVIHNWIDSDLFKPMPVEKQPRTICFVGRLEEQKNVRALIEAMNGVDGKLVIYGDGSLKKAFEELARALHVDVKFRGHIANEKLPIALSACTIFVLPSLYEGNPKVLLEAMACGLPVVGTNVEGITSIIQHEKTGLLCGTQPDSIRQTINRLLDEPELRSRLGEAARNSILESSTLEQAIQKETILIAELDSDR